MEPFDIFSVNRQKFENGLLYKLDRYNIEPGQELTLRFRDITSSPEPRFAEVPVRIEDESLHILRNRTIARIALLNVDGLERAPQGLDILIGNSVPRRGNLHVMGELAILNQRKAQYRTADRQSETLGYLITTPDPILDGQLDIARDIAGEAQTVELPQFEPAVIARR